MTRPRILRAQQQLTPAPGDLAFGAPFGMLETCKDAAPVAIDHEAAMKNYSTTKAEVQYIPAVQILNDRGNFSASLGVLALPQPQPALRVGLPEGPLREAVGGAVGLQTPGPAVLAVHRAAVGPEVQGPAQVAPLVDRQAGERLPGDHFGVELLGEREVTAVGVVVQDREIGVARRGVGLIIGLVALGIALTPGAGARVGAFFAQLITG